jgi:hypothetical protein
VKCSRPKCVKGAHAAGLCHAHFDHAIKTGVLVAGKTDSVKAQQHLAFLTESGMSLQEITRACGLAWPTLRNIRSGGLILRSTEKRLLSVQPVLDARTAPESKVPALGTRRRLQALVAIGYTARYLSQRLGVQGVTVWRYCTRSERVELYMAKRVIELYDELHMTPGPSVKARNRARKCGWAPPLAFDDIDDPTEKPNVGDRIHLSVAERIAELQEIGIRDRREIAQRLGVKPESVERALMRSEAA